MKTDAELRHWAADTIRTQSERISQLNAENRKLYDALVSVGLKEFADRELERVRRRG